MTVKELLAVLPALLLLLPQGASGAANLHDAARDVARRAAQFTGTRDAVALSVRNLSPLSAAEAGRARQEVESALRDAGVRLQEGAAVELRITLSGNTAHYLLVGEGRRGDERQTWIAEWPLTAALAAGPAGVLLEKRLLWEQDSPVLDAIPLEDALLVLSPGNLTLYARNNEGWLPRQSVNIAAPRPWPRDPRGLLQATGSALRVFLPGVTCSGAWQPALAVECRPGDDAWTLASGTQQILVAAFAATRNYFDGRVTTQAGARKTVAPFYTAAAVDDAGDPLWLLAGVDGSTQIYTAAFEPAGAIAAWGSDIAGTNARCGSAQQVLATRADDSGEAVQLFRIASRQAEPLSAPLAMPGPVTALWSMGASALAVTRDANTGRYAAWWLTISCGT